MTHMTPIERIKLQFPYLTAAGKRRVVMYLLENGMLPHTIAQRLEDAERYMPRDNE